MTQPEPSEQFGHYRVYEKLGTGGMATVHRAIHSDGTEVALKRLLPSLERHAANVEQFVREAEIAESLDHPNIVGVKEHGVIGGRRFLAMERIKGRSLLTLLQWANRQRQVAPIGVAMYVVYKSLVALEFAMFGLDASGTPHRVVHRDLSPSNISITESGTVKLIDFGVAKSLEGRHATNTGRVKGKLGYMAPELLRRAQVDARSDVFSLSVVAWELCTSQRLFCGDEREQMEQRAAGRAKAPPSEVNPWVPSSLESLIATGLQEEPDDRFASAAEMRAALEPLLKSEGRAASRQALVTWIKQLRKGRHVSATAKTEVHAPKELRMIVSSTKRVPGVTHFYSDVQTEVDTTALSADVSGALSESESRHEPPTQLDPIEFEDILGSGLDGEDTIMPSSEVGEATQMIATDKSGTKRE